MQSVWRPYSIFSIFWSLYRFLLISFVAVLNFTEGQQCSDQTICQAGGTCIIASSLPAKHSCTSGQIYHVGYCYTFLDQQLPWNAAADYCQKEGGQLAWTKTEDEATFYAGYIPGVLQGLNQQSQFPPGVWTAVRGVNNQTRPAWLIYPGSYLVTKFYWDQGEPNIYMNYADVCVSLESSSHYMRWSTANCNEPKYVVCKNKITADADNFVTQCLCQPGRGGTFCDKQEQIQTQITCGSQPFQFACQNGETIRVEYASFGAVEGQRCNSNLTNVVQTCSNVYSLQTMINTCQGLPYCTVPNLADIFTDTPCSVNEELFLQYRITCIQEPQAKCASGSFYYGGRCYKINYENNSKKQANFPQAGGALLSSVNSDLLQELQSQMRKVAKGNADVWVNMQMTQSGPQWADGTQAQNLPSTSNLAANSQAPCVVLSFASDSSLPAYNSVPCSRTANVICQQVPLGAANDTTNARPSQDPPTPAPEKFTVFKGEAL